MRLDGQITLRARERLGYSAADAAREAGVATNSVLRAEHGEDIRPATARKLAAGLGVRVADLISEGAERAGKAEPRQLSGLSSEEKEARRREHNWTTILSGALYRIEAVEKQTREEDLDFYPDPKDVYETYALLCEYERVGGARGSEQLEAVEARISTVLARIEWMYRHKGAPLDPEVALLLGRSSKPGQPARTFSRDAADSRQADEAN